MPIILLSTFIKAPVQLCFDLSRSIELHMESTAKTKERAIAGRTSGMIENGETVTWEAVHFGVRQRLTVQITAMERPNYFTDTMLKGAFKSMHHEHFFEVAPGGTVMRDVFTYRAPLGILGRLAETLVLNRYMRRFLLERNEVIKRKAEAG